MVSRAIYNIVHLQIDILKGGGLSRIKTSGEQIVCLKPNAKEEWSKCLFKWVYIDVNSG